MKKCASCTKDLPDAALHCVFCGAKQAPSPAVQPTNAKTVMGYGGQELEALRAQAAARNASASAPPPIAPAPVAPTYTPPAAAQPAPYTPPAAQPAPYNPPAAQAASYTPPAAQPAPYNPPAAQPAPYNPPRAHSPSQQPLAPASSANAKTMFVDNGPPAAAPANLGIGGDRTMVAPPSQPAGAFHVPPPSAATLAQAQANQLPMPSAQHAPMPVAPIQPVTQAAPPYLASQTAARAARPIEPWKSALPMMMFIWGGLLIAAFVTPISTDPMAFNWDAIIHGEGALKLGPLILAATGLLTVAMAAIPLATGARGVMALLLGLTGIFVPMFIGGVVPPWQSIVSTVGMVLLPMSLLARHEYRDASLPRILVTVGALCALVPYVVPVNGSVILVELFKAVIDAPGALKIILILILGQIVLVVLSLLAWLPAPGSGGAKPIAWLLILYPLFMHAALLFLVGDPANITNTPYAGAMSWLVGGAGAGGGGEMAAIFGGGAGLGVAYLAITGYGGATVLGKQLES